MIIIQIIFKDWQLQLQSSFLQQRQQHPQQSLSHSASTASCSDSSRVATSSVTAVSCVNGVTDSCNTQTKSVAPVSEQSAVPKGILKGTVTKVKPVVTVGDSSANDGCSAAVKRSMTFADSADDAPTADVKAASPVARLTFAEVVRSPPPPTSLRRSPLASKENLPPAEIGPEVFNTYVEPHCSFLLHGRLLVCYRRQIVMYL